MKNTVKAKLKNLSLKNKNEILIETGIAFVLITICVVSRLMPHIPNVTALAATALLGVRLFRQTWVPFVVTLVALFISDAWIGFHSTSAVVYGAMGIILLMNFRRVKKFSWQSLAVSSFSASTWFFIITNLGVWYYDEMYEKSLQGLVYCFTLAIPFYWTQMAGDFLYIFSLFGIFEAIRSMMQSRTDIEADPENS